MRQSAAVPGLLVVIGLAIAMPTSGRAAISVACCPNTIANSPCTPVLHDNSEGAPSIGLRSLLAPLRRAQTPADLPLRSYPESSGISLGEELGVGEGVYTGFIRRAAVVHGWSLYLVPVARACENGRVVHEAIFLDSVGASMGETGGPVTAPSIKRQGFQAGLAWGPEGNVPTEKVSGIVPEGVAKVTLLYGHLRGFPVSVTVRVVHNVYAAFVPYPAPVPPKEASGPGSFSPPGPRKILWRSHTGRVLKTLRFL